MRIERNETGQAMVATLFVVVLMAVTAVTYLTASFQLGVETNAEIGMVRARLAAEEGVHLAMAELKSGDDPDGDGLGTVSLAGADDRSIVVTATDLGGDLYRVHAVARVGGAAQGLEAIIELVTAPGVAFPARAAITAEGPVETLGTINVDGRDWDDWATALVGPGLHGISSTQGVTQGGSSTVGGSGNAPAKPAPVGGIEQFAVWQDGVDADGDGLIDEEPYDGIDNDGDGAIDEDTHGYPESPDAALGQPPGTLKSIAQAAGTYFATETALNNWIAANGGSIPGGVIVYADFNHWQPADFGPIYNDPPSIIVHHTKDGDALMKNIHGAFRGLIMADFVTHINGDCSIIGAFMSFSDESYGNAFGNGNADVLFSSTVLANLPNAFATASARVLSWSRASLN